MVIEIYSYMTTDYARCIPQSVLNELADEAKKNVGQRCSRTVTLCCNDCVYNPDFTGSAQRTCDICLERETKSVEKRNNERKTLFYAIDESIHAMMSMAPKIRYTDEQLVETGIPGISRNMIQDQVNVLSNFIGEQIKAMTTGDRELLRSFIMQNMQNCLMTFYQ